jgi:hypothetical protein
VQISRQDCTVMDLLEFKRTNVGQSVMDDKHPILVKFWMACALERTPFGCLSITGGICTAVLVACGKWPVAALGNSLVGTCGESPTCCEAVAGKKGDGKIVDVFDDMSDCVVFEIEGQREGLTWLTHVENIWTRVDEESVVEVVVGLKF